MPGDRADSAGTIEIVEPGIAVGMHPAAEAGEMVLRSWPLRSPEKR